jgi:hypothetical protein
MVEILDKYLLSPIIQAITTIIAGLFVVYLTNKYKKDREREERDRKRREANALVADILAAWVHPTFDPDATDIELNKYLYEMQITYWKSILWIDKELLLMLNRCIANSGAPNTNEMIAQTRKYIQGLEEPDIAGEDIIDWSYLIKKQKII